MIKSILTTTSTNMTESRHNSTKQHTTTGFARRALLLVSFLMIGLGSAWGQTFNTKTDNMVDGAVVEDKYLDVLNKYEASCNIGVDEVVKALNSMGSKWTEDNIADNIYIRWSILNQDGEIADNYVHSSTIYDYQNNLIGLDCEASKDKWNWPWSSEIAGFYWFQDCDVWTNYSLSSILKVSVHVNQNKYFSSFSEYKVVCYITDDLSGITSPPDAYNNGSLNNEPDFKVKYVFHFGAKVDDFTNVTDGVQTGTYSDEISADRESLPIDLSNAFAETDNYKYVRIFLKNNEGKASDPEGKLTVSYQGEPLGLSADFKERGYYYYNATDVLNPSDFRVTLNLPKGQYEDYQVVCVFAKDVDYLWPKKEPEWNLQFTYTFAYPFKGDATNAVKMESTLKIPGSKKTETLTLSFDYGHQLIKLTSNDTEIATAPIDPKFLEACPTKDFTNDYFYIRWFLQQNGGGETYVENSLAKAYDNYLSPAKERYYYYWTTDKDQSTKDLEKILQIKLNGSQLSELTAYDLVFTIATKKDGIDYVDGELTHEPDEMVYQYTFHLEDKSFEAENISTVKTIYKTALYDKTTGEITPDLFSNYNDVLADLEVATLSQIPTYLRWYVTDSEGNVVSMSEKNLSFNGNGKSYSNNDPYGHYMYTEWGIGQWDATSYNPIITLPANEKETGYKNYQVVCVITTDMAGMSLPDNEPSNMQVKYVFSQLIPKDELETLFVHYKGLSGRDFIQGSGAGNVTQQYWDEKTGRIVETEQDIRQGVHTWEYDIYVVPGGGPRKLILPFQYYDDGKGGNADEPRGYIRWYDWNTDTKVVSDGSFTFAKVEVSELKEKDRGLFGIKISNHPIHDNIGVTFTPEAGFDGSVDIACDISKYSDGIMEVNNQNYYLHEPTLSNRYIFHIRPASEMADDLDAAKQRLIGAGSDAEAFYKAMSTLKEDKGKVVVSIANDNSVFALRFDQQELGSYILNNGNSYVSADEVQWYAYYDNRGTISIEPEPVSWSKVDETKRIYSFTYEKVKNINNGNKFHIVGYVGQSGFNVKTNSGVYAPVAHYELSFIDAPPIPADKIIAGTVEEEYINRTEPYMQANNYVRAGIVDFDGNPETNPNVVGREAQYFKTDKWDDAPTSSENNSTYEPFLWDDIQYGFCYPPLTGTIMNGYSHFAHYVSPEHGEYIILKSMNMPGVSTHWQVKETPPYNYNLWGAKLELHDYTYYATNGAQHGSFLYTDASDESRSIATIPFVAEDLCAGSSIYFTAVVANETEDYDHVFPQLLIRIVGIDNKGNRQRIVAFHTGELDNQYAGVEMGKWYQIYGASTLPKDFDPTITQFEAEVINYASGTWGADFAFDQFVIYTTSAKVLLTQTPSSSCGDQSIADNQVQIYMEAEGLQNAFDDPEGPQIEGRQPIYWRIYEKGESGANDKLVTGMGMYPQYSSDGTLISGDKDLEKRNTYGVVWVKLDFTDPDDIENPTLLADTLNAPYYGWYHDVETDRYFFQIANKNFGALERGKNYYVSVYDPCIEDDFDENIEGNWGRKEIKCSIYSDFFIPRRQYVTYIVDPETGKEGGELTIPCGSTDVEIPEVQMVFKVPDPTNKITGFTEYPMTFDYAFCSMENWDKSSVELEGDNQEHYTYNELAQAWRDYRDKWLKDNSLTVDKYSHDNYPRYQKALEYAINQGILILANSEKFSHKFTKNDETNLYHVLCLPVEGTVTIKEKQEDGTEKDVETTVCDFFEVIFTVKSGGSLSLELGFKDVNYANHGNVRVVRAGLEQLNNAKKNGAFTLHIPVHSFESASGNIVFDNADLLLENTTDKTKSTNTIVATLLDDTDAGRPTVNNDHQYIAVKFNNDFTFYEGYEYELHTVYYDKNDDDDNTPKDGVCTGDMNFIIKVVPKYVTWNDGTTAEESNNWNHDKNWSRSTRNELHKDDTSSNHDSYEDNDDLRKKGVIIDGRPAFVPMKFTYVTMPTPIATTKIPNLVGLGLASNGIYNNIGVGATGNIEYDLMVRYTEEYCLGHDKSSGTTTITGNIYDCEKFYGNWAKEIYFKPRAELVNQHYLTYEKVWVEKELTAGMWTLMSTPLQNTYAGDMYVPVGGRQETEAFKDITFGLTDYSRTKYPIYQRSWGMNEGKVYTKSEDVRNTDYSALLKFPTKTVETIFAEWSHTFNDVWVDYSTWKGFAVRAHKSDYTGTRNNALLRLPKADNSYQYYDWNDYYNEQQPTMPDDKALGRGKYGKLFTDSDNAGNITYGVIYGTQARTTKDNAEVTVPVGKVQEVDGYLLVGNPYLCSIDMAVFLKTNENILENKYWTYEGNTTSSQLSNGKIQPLQSFFVRKLANTTTNDIKFTSAMMVGNGGVPKVMPKPMMTMTATNDRGKSTATVSVVDEARSVETLFDSNLNDVPMVYTVAEGQAVSINQLTEFDKPIAFGVTCTASNEPVAVTFTDIEQLTSGDVFVVDAVTGEQTAVGEGSSVSVQPNDYGRYFLLPGTMGINDKTAVQKGIVVSIRDRGVTITSGEALTLVRATLLDGITAYQYTGGDTTASFTLTPGVYIIHAENAAGEQQKAKVIVK